MQVHQNKRLFDLAQKQAQRQSLTELAQDPKSALYALWNGKRHIYHPETPIAIQEAYSRCAGTHDGVGNPSKSVLRKLRTSSTEKAYAWLLSELLALPDYEYMASFGTGDSINFESSTYWVPHLPITCVTSSEVTAAFRNKGELPFEQLALVSTNGAASLVLDSSVGFMAEEPNEDDIIYELATFRDA